MDRRPEIALWQAALPRPACGQPNRVVGDLVLVAAPGQEAERPGSVGVLRQGPAASGEQVAGPADLSLVRVRLDRRLGENGHHPARQQSLANSLGAPAAQLALVLGVAPGEALIVELSDLRQATDRRLDLLGTVAPPLEPRGQLGARPLPVAQRAEGDLERV